MIEKLFSPQRTQPPHTGHMSFLEQAAIKSEHLIIGIGSSNKFDEWNPYTAEERELMLTKSFEDMNIANYSFIHVPDFHDNDIWLDYVEERGVDNKDTTVISGNQWCHDIFGEKGYSVITPESIIEIPKIDISATKLREMILNDDNTWKEYAATGTLHYFEKFGGKERLERYL